VDIDATLVTAHSDKQAAGRQRAGSGITRRGRSPTTAQTAPASHWRCCAARLGERGQQHRHRLSYSVAFGLPANTARLLTQLHNDVWQVASDGSVRSSSPLIHA